MANSPPDPRFDCFPRMLGRVCKPCIWEVEGRRSPSLGNNSERLIMKKPQSEIPNQVKFLSLTHVGYKPLIRSLMLIEGELMNLSEWEYGKRGRSLTVWCHSFDSTPVIGGSGAAPGDRDEAKGGWLYSRPLGRPLTEAIDLARDAPKVHRSDSSLEKEWQRVLVDQASSYGGIFHCSTCAIDRLRSRPRSNGSHFGYVREKRSLPHSQHASHPSVPKWRVCSSALRLLEWNRCVLFWLKAIALPLFVLNGTAVLSFAFGGKGCAGRKHSFPVVATAPSYLASSCSFVASVSVVPVSPDWINWRERMAGSEATDALAQSYQSHISSWSEGPALASVMSRVRGMVIPELVNSSPRC
ncbi:hypothetical protein ACFE04_019669 [Oxalis oulophora]